MQCAQVTSVQPGEQARLDLDMLETPLILSEEELSFVAPLYQLQAETAAFSKRGQSWNYKPIQPAYSTESTGRAQQKT